MAEGAAGAVAEAPKAVGSFLTKKAGPLPVWAWGGLLIVGVGGFLYFRSRQGSNALSPGLANALGALGVGAPDTGSASGSSSSTPAAPLTNSQWLTNVLSDAASSAGVPLTQAQLYLQDFLNGTPPNLSGSAETAYQAVVNAALSLGGQPPSVGVAPAGTNPFSSNANWLNEIFSFLPSGTFEGESNAQIQQALTNWVNGVSTTLTQAEADALASAQGIVGSAPTPLSYTISNVASNLNQWTASLVSAGLPGGTAQSAAARVPILQAYFPDLTADQAGQLSSAFHVYGGGGGPALSSDQAVALYNSWLSQIRAGQGAQLIANLQRQFNYYQ